jgi:hypothetical protein
LKGGDAVLVRAGTDGNQQHPTPQLQADNQTGTSRINKELLPNTHTVLEAWILEHARGIGHYYRTRAGHKALLQNKRRS